MSSSKNDRQGFHRILQLLSSIPARFGKLLNTRNVKILLKALREEPPDLVYENFLQLLRRGRGQSVYTRKFFQEDEHLKVYLLDARKDAGILKVVVWILSRRAIERVSIFNQEEELPARPEQFVKPELSALFSDYVDFKQQGYLFQLPYKGVFSDVYLQLSDETGHRIKIPVGRFFEYESNIDEVVPEAPLPGMSKLLLVLHDWNLSRSVDSTEFSTRRARLAALGVKLLVCNQKPLPVSPENNVEYTGYLELNERLEEYRSSGITHTVLMAQDVILPEDFFQKLTRFLQGNPESDLLYFDEDLLAPNGRYHSPNFKPDYSPEYLAADNYIGHNFCISNRIGAELNWFSPLDFRSGAYHFLLRATEVDSSLIRLPEVIIHCPEQDLAYFTRKEAAEIQARTVYFLEKGVRLDPGLVPGSSEVLRPLDRQPLVSIIIPFKDQKALLEQCLESVFSKTKHSEFELLLISNNSQEAETFEYLEAITQEYPQVKWFRRDHPFNFSQLNNWAAQRAKGEFILLLNNDVEVITSGWLRKMLSYFIEERVGAVGVKLLYPDHTVQHAGIVTGIGGIAGHAQKHYPDHYSGYNGRINKVQNVTACTAACLMIRRSLYEAVGGMDEKNLPVAFNDVDLCLKIHTAGYRIVYTPFVKLFHHESISRGAEDTAAKRKRAKREIRFFRKKWRNFIKAGDPYYHPNLSKRMADFEDFRIMDS